MEFTGHLFRRWQHRFRFNSMSRYLPGIYMADWNFEAIEEAFSDAAVNPAVWARALNVVTAQTPCDFSEDSRFEAPSPSLVARRRPFAEAAWPLTAIIF